MINKGDAAASIVAVVSILVLLDNLAGRAGPPRARSQRQDGSSAPPPLPQCVTGCVRQEEDEEARRWELLRDVGGDSSRDLCGALAVDASRSP